MNKWEIRDETGVIHSGPEDEMRKAWNFMTLSLKELKETYPLTMREIRNTCNEYGLDWEGDIELLEVHAIHR